MVELVQANLETTLERARLRWKAMDDAIACLRAWLNNGRGDWATIDVPMVQYAAHLLVKAKSSFCTSVRLTLQGISERNGWIALYKPDDVIWKELYCDPPLLRDLACLLYNVAEPADWFTYWSELRGRVNRKVKWILGSERVWILLRHSFPSDDEQDLFIREIGKEGSGDSLPNLNWEHLDIRIKSCGLLC